MGADSRSDVFRSEKPRDDCTRQCDEASATTEPNVGEARAGASTHQPHQKTCYTSGMKFLRLFVWIYFALIPASLLLFNFNSYIFGWSLGLFFALLLFFPLVPIALIISIQNLSRGIKILKWLTSIILGTFLYVLSYLLLSSGYNPSDNGALVGQAFSVIGIVAVGVFSLFFCSIGLLVFEYSAQKNLDKK